MKVKSIFTFLNKSFLVIKLRWLKGLVSKADLDYLTLANRR